MPDSLTPVLQSKLDQLPSYQRAAVVAYREALKRRADWMDAVIAAVEAAREELSDE